MMIDMSSVRRGFVEGLFILVSILLAFGADAWWDQRQARDLETAMLSAVAAELARNREALADNVATLDAYLDRVDRLLVASDSALLALPPDSVASWVAALPGRASFNGDLEATTMLLQTPAIDSERSLAIRARLAEWRNDIDEAELLGLQLDQAAIRVNELLARYAARTASGGGDQVARMAARLGGAGLLELRRDEVLMGAVLAKADAQLLHRLFLIRAGRSIDDIEAEVRALAVG